MNLRNTVFATVWFFLGAIISKVVIWDILDFIRTLLQGMFTGGDNISLIFLIIQWILTILFVFIIPIAIFNGKGDQIADAITSKLSGQGGKI